MILLVALLLMVGGGIVAARGLGGFREDGQRPWAVAGCVMFIVGALTIGAFLFALRGIPGFVF